MIAAGSVRIVSKDDAGVRTAILELLEEALLNAERKKVARLAESAENRERMLEDSTAKRSLEDGYYVWAQHLMLCERMLGLQTRCPLTADESRGVMLLRDVAAEFARKHPPCPHCGRALQDALATHCRACGKRTEDRN